VESQEEKPWKCSKNEDPQRRKSSNFEIVHDMINNLFKDEEDKYVKPKWKPTDSAPISPIRKFDDFGLWED